MNPQLEQTLPLLDSAAPPASEIRREVIMDKGENSNGSIVKIMETDPNLCSFPSPLPPSITWALNPAVPAASAVQRSRRLALPPMNPQLEETDPLLDSAPPASEIRREVIMDNGSIVKIMETVSFVFEVDDFSSHFCKGMGDLIESSPFGVGGYSFSIQLYPNGANRRSFISGDTSLFIKNLTPKTAHLAVDLYFFNVYCPLMDPLRGLSSSLDRELYRQVVTVEPGAVHGVMHLYHRNYIANRYCSKSKDSLKIKATIGIVSYHNHHPRPLPPHSSLCILFQVEAYLYYALESVITARCPALLQDYPHSNHIVLIPDVESHVFKAVLWFLHNNRLHVIDRYTIRDNRKELFSRKLIEAADKFKLKDLRRHCESLLYYGDSEVIACYYKIESNVKQLWENISGLPQKMKELILPQKMKAA